MLIFFRKIGVYKLIAALLLPLSSYAGAIEDATEAYSRGAYQEALAKLAQDNSAVAESLKGRIYFKLQNFPESIRAFLNADRLKDNSPSLYYDLGQALYANKDFKTAREAFKRSIVNKYKVGASAYYIGYISQLLEDYALANDYYSRIQRLFNDFDSVQQAALLQMAEIAYVKAEAIDDEDEKKLAWKKSVLPMYERVKKHDPSTAVSKQAQARIREIEQKISGEAIRMRNGLPIPQQAYALKLSQNIGWNSNIVTQADQALTQISDKDSFYFYTGVLAKYQFNYKETYSLIPEFNTNFTLHSRRETRSVYQNDNWVIAPALRTKFEHWLAATPATFLFDIEYNLMLRDYQQRHSLPYYSRYWNFTFGERAKLFEIGSTTVKAGVKFYENYNPDRNSISPTLAITQNIRIGTNDLSNTLTLDYLRARNDLNDEQNIKFRHSMEFSDFWKDIDFTPGLTWSFKDTMKQKGERGVEILVNPSVGINYDYTDKFSVNAEYGFTKNFSKAKRTYQYTQHDLKIGAVYSF